MVLQEEEGRRSEEVLMNETIGYGYQCTHTRIEIDQAILYVILEVQGYDLWGSESAVYLMLFFLSMMSNILALTNGLFRRTL